MSEQFNDAVMQDSPAMAQMAAGRTQYGTGIGNAKTNAPGMIQDALDRNGNILVALDQVNARLQNIIDRMIGPRPQPAGSAPDSPDGVLNLLGAQQAVMSEKVSDINALINQLDELL